MIKVPFDLDDAEKDIYKSAFKWCEGLVQKGLNIYDSIEQTSERYKILISDIDAFKEFLQREVTAYTEPAIVIPSLDIQDNTWWDNLLSDSSFSAEYWERYYNYLLNKPSWSIKAARDIDDSTNELMNLLANPRSGMACDRMGMVFGYVQSGKTAHYIGLINKAFDSGYRFIIVLSGIHNSLRSQTQSRIDEEVLGYETSLEDIGNYSKQKNAIGVAKGKHNSVTELVQSVTTRDEKGDFNAKTEGVNLIPPFLIVTKKNASVLRRIIRYFKKLPYAEVENGKKFIPEKYPVLIIDDEADQASINTKASYDANGNVLEDYNPTTINGLIRELLQLFKVRSYVGYTATPFANIFIPPYLEDEKYGKDLYPRDFIVRAPRADQYIGGREFFGLKSPENTPTMPLCEDIVEGASFLSGSKSDDPVGELPVELKKAVKFFLISTALRNLRGQRNKPNTMLVHIVRYVKQQNKIKHKIKDYLENEVMDYITYGDEAIEKELKAIWSENYCKKTVLLKADFARYMDGCREFKWLEIWNEIRRIVREKEILVYSVNGKSEDALLYKRHEGKPFNVIVVGGDKLSRGLTLEGLTISYFTRGSSTYDTLMQMGRWFGFRPGYLDLCRLFTTKLLRGYFAHISMATENLASQFDYMNDIAHSTPEEFGLRVATHPDLSITSKNKLRTGEESRRDFSANLSQTRVFDIDPVVFENNFDAVETLLMCIKNYRISANTYQLTHEGRKQPGKHYFWQNVPSHDVITFFENYQTSRTATRSNSKYMADYVREMSSVGGLTNWTVCLINVENKNYPRFDIAGLNVGAGIYRQEGRGVQSFDGSVSIHTMTSAGHEYFDYTDKQMTKVNDIRLLHPTSEETLNEYIRKQTRPFENGLLLLYPIADAGELTKAKTDKTPFGVAVVFPDRQGKGELQTYRMTDIAVEKDNDEFYN